MVFGSGRTVDGMTDGGMPCGNEMTDGGMSDVVGMGGD